MFGRLLEQVSGLSSQLPALSEKISRQTELLNTQERNLDQYWTGLKRANEDIRNINQTMRDISLRMETFVTLDRFERLEGHVKTLNGTDSKFKSLGIDLEQSDQWRDVLAATRRRHEDRRSTFRHVIQGVTLVVVIYIGAQLWDGVKDDITGPSAQQVVKGK